jgi:hypothetical protein
MSDIAHVVVGHLKNKQRLGRHAVQNKILAPPPRGQRCTLRLDAMAQPKQADAIHPLGEGDLTQLLGNRRISMR